MSRVWRSIGRALTVVALALLAHCVPPDMAHSVAYDALFAGRELAMRAGLWNIEALDGVPRCTDEISDAAWDRASGLVVLVHGYSAYRHQMVAHVRALHGLDPTQLVVVPEVHVGGNAALDDVLRVLLNDTRPKRPLPTTWIGVSNGARLAVHAVARTFNDSSPPTLVIPVVGPLNGTTRVDWLRGTLGRLLGRHPAWLDELRYPSEPPPLAGAYACDRLAWRPHGARYDYAIAPHTSSLQLPYACTQHTLDTKHGHTSAPYYAAATHAQMAVQWNQRRVADQP